jgi:hypothetical protein
LRPTIIAVSSTARPDTVKALDQRAQTQGVGVPDALTCRGRFAADDGMAAGAGMAASPMWWSAGEWSIAASARLRPFRRRGPRQVGKTKNNPLPDQRVRGGPDRGREGQAETTGIDLVKLREAPALVSWAPDAPSWANGLAISFTRALTIQIVADMTDRAPGCRRQDHRRDQGWSRTRRIKASNPPK